MAFHYESMLCPRCRIAIQHINEAHTNSKMLFCRSNKPVKGAFVYLMHDKTNDFLKIGYSENPIRRHKEIVHGSTNEISLLGFFPGSMANEHIVHGIFKKSRVKREWFRNDTDIIDYFEEHPCFKGGPF